MSDRRGPENGPIYLDAHATTPCDPEVVRAMVPCLAEDFGNPASTQHAHGRRAARRVERARQQVASLLGCSPAEIVFTSGATEADNLAIFGASEAATHRGRHIVTCATEHKAVLDTCAALERRGFEVTYLGVEGDGRVHPAAVEAALRPDTVLVSLMMANNEIGVLHPLADISALCRQRGIRLHTDAAQAAAVLPCRVDDLGVDLLSLSAHKIYGPQGVGALYVRRRRPHVRLAPQMHGGGHERGRRSGTLPVALLVGFGVACELAAKRHATDGQHLRNLRDRLLAQLEELLPALVLNGSLEHRLPHNLNVSLPGVEATTLIEALEDVALSSGSACTSAAHDSSYVVRLLPDGETRAHSALRCGLLRTTPAAEVDQAARSIARAAEAVRGTVPEHLDPCYALCEA